MKRLIPIPLIIGLFISSCTADHLQLIEEGQTRTSDTTEIDDSSNSIGLNFNLEAEEFEESLEIVEIK